MNRFLSAQFIRFFMANVFAAAMNIATRLVASLAMLDAWAVAAGFCTGLATSYLLCRAFVFKTARRASIAEAGRFIGINLLALGITWIVYNASLHWLLCLRGESAPTQGLRTLAHAVGVAAPVAFSFLAQKTFTFRQRF